MILILQIALGIVLAVVILNYLPQLLGLGVVALKIGLGLVIVAGAIYLTYLAISSPEFKDVLHSPEVSYIGAVAVVAALLLFHYKFSFGESPLEVFYGTFILAIGFLGGIGSFVDELGGRSSPTILITSLMGGLFSGTLLLLRGFARFGIPNELQRLAQKIPPRMMRWLGLSSKSEVGKV